MPLEELGRRAVELLLGHDPTVDIDEMISGPIELVPCASTAHANVWKNCLELSAELQRDERVVEVHVVLPSEYWGHAEVASLAG